MHGAVKSMSSDNFLTFFIQNKNMLNEDWLLQEVIYHSSAATQWWTGGVHVSDSHCKSVCSPCRFFTCVIKVMAFFIINE